MQGSGDPERENFVQKNLDRFPAPVSVGLYRTHSVERYIYGFVSLIIDL